MRHSHDLAGSGTRGLPNVSAGVRGVDLCGTSLVKDPKAITLSFVLENDPALIPAVVTQLMEAACGCSLFDEMTAERVAMAVHEAILNGMHHGNLELDSLLRQGDEKRYQRLAATRRRTPPYQGRQVHVQARFGPDAAVFVIRDEGRGFDHDRLPDPTQPPSLQPPIGRGLLLIRSFMDEVSFNETGTEITLIKRRSNRS